MVFLWLDQFVIGIVGIGKIFDDVVFVGKNDRCDVGDIGMYVQQFMFGGCVFGYFLKCVWFWFDQIYVVFQDILELCCFIQFVMMNEMFQGCNVVVGCFG